MSIEYSDQQEQTYPTSLRAAENEQIRLRRAQLNIDPRAPAVGVGLSGGGIRSATFCIGVFQALARLKLVRKIDYLSTVSGGGYFGGFLGASFSREGATADKIEKELSDNHSWSIQWLRDNGRFLSPNGAGDSWIAAAVMLRNWAAVHCVMLTFAFLVFGFGVLLRAELTTTLASNESWMKLEHFMWTHKALGIWWSPWVLLPVIPFITMMVPGGVLFWLTQSTPLMGALRKIGAIFSKDWRSYSDNEFISHAQNRLTTLLVLGFIPTLVLAAFAVVDSLGQTAYWKWSADDFQFPTLWATLTGIGFGAYGLASKIYILIENLVGKGKFKITVDAVALLASIAWTLLIIIGVSVAACSLAWSKERVAIDGQLMPMNESWRLSIAVITALALSWFFSRSFAFVNLSSLQQVYAARLRRAYIGATNLDRQASENFSMTDLIPGDDFLLEEYQPQKSGGPLHLINVTVNETLSDKTHIERRDRKGLAMAVGPCGISVGDTAHSLWADPADAPKRLGRSLLSALFEDPCRPVAPIVKEPEPGEKPNSAHGVHPKKSVPINVECLSLGRWIAISGAAFTTGLGERTNLGLSLLLGLANVRLGYWWDSGLSQGTTDTAKDKTFAEVAGRVFHYVLPLQACLVNEFFARFHGAARRYWYLSDGGHFENTGCYELIRRRVPFILCTDGGSDPDYQFADLANLVRKARIDFGAEIEIIRRADDADKKEPGHDLPSLEQLVHPSVVDMFGAPEDFHALSEEEVGAPANRRHALLARIRYSDTGETGWLLVIKPGLGGDEPVDVLQYQRTHPLFPQEPTSDQFFDEAQWESYRKLAQHIVTALFTAPTDGDPRWSPSRFAAPEVILSEDDSIPAVSRSPLPAANGATQAVLRT
ncbi:MAG: hypothetical protein QM715_05470 [Nibricoccus sp.]